MPGATAGACPAGSAAIIPHSTVQAIRAIQAEAIAAEAAMEVAEATDVARPTDKQHVLIYCHMSF